MSIFGLGDLVTTVEARIAVSVALAVLALVSAYAVRRFRSWLSQRIAPITVDLIGSLLSIAIVLAALLAVVDLWGQTEAIAEQVGIGEFEETAPQMAVTIVVLVAVHSFTTVARRLLDDITQESEAMSEHERELSFRLVQLLLWSVGLLIVLGVWEINLGGLLIGAGFLGIVVGLAARQTLASMLAGLVLMFSRPFEVGDWIEIGEGANEAEGIVTDITLMNTRIQAFDGEFVMVPNDVIGSRMVRNRSRKGRLRVEVEVGIDYQADVERARTVATDTVREISMIMEVPRPETVTKDFGESQVTLGVRGWIERPSSRRRWRARTRMIRGVKEAFAEEGIKIPFPQRELTGRVEEGGLRLAREQRGVDGRGSAPGEPDSAADASEGGPGAARSEDESPAAEAEDVHDPADAPDPERASDPEDDQ